MHEKKSHKKFIDVMAELQEEEALDLVRQYIADGVDPMVIIDLCHRGMVRVGERYEQGRYFISGLIMAGEIMRRVGEMVFPLLKSKITNGDSGRIVLGTVEGDIHFIGKDIFKVLVRGYGFTVHDLGVDVPPSKFLSAVHEFKPDIIGLSCLISTAYRAMREAIAFLKKNIPQNLSPQAYLIGGRVSELVRKDVGANYWVSDGMKGVRFCQKIINGDS